MKTREIAGKFWIRAETKMEIYRADSFHDKEPETLKWIESFKGGTFADVGANIGIYSLYCSALHPDMAIYAFEPVRQNYDRLVENINLNGFINISAMNCAVGSVNGMTRIYIPENEIGKSGAQIHTPVNEHNVNFNPVEVQDIYECTLDAWPDIDYLKIDVDGHELDVLAGARGMINRFKSLLIECNRDKIDVSRITDGFIKLGLFPDRRFNDLPDHSRYRRGGNPENIVFSRA